MSFQIRLCAAILAVSSLFTAPVLAQNSGPLRIEITEGVIEPLPFALPVFEAETSDAGEMAAQITQVIASDLTGTGLFRQIEPGAFISTVNSFAAPIQYADWKAINAQALITGAVAVQGNQLNVKFRLYDVFSGAEMGDGLQFSATPEGWRRMAHKVADAVYSPDHGARAGISTAAWSMSRKPAPRTRAKSGWRSWIMTEQT